MKFPNTRISPLFLCFWLLPLSAAFSNAAQDLYFNESTSTTEPNRFLGESANWYTDEGRTEQFTGTLGSDCNGIVNTESVICTTVKASDNLTFNSLTYNFSYAGMNNDFMVSFGAGGRLNLAGDFNLNVTLEPAIGGVPLEENVMMYGNNTFNIGGDFNIDYSRNGSGRYLVVNIKTNSLSSGTSNTFHVAGDMNIISRQADAKMRFGTSISQFTVDGIVDMSVLQWTIGTPGEGYASTASVGGLTTASGSTGWLITAGGAGMGTLVFTNSARQDASVTYGYVDTESMLNITMRASNAQSGYQILRIRSGAYGATDANLGDVIIDTGRLDLGMHSNMKGARLSLSGTEAMFSATASDSGNIGTVTFDEGEWYAGKIAIDIEGEQAYDKIVFNGRFDKTGSNHHDMGFEFVFDAYVMRDLISANNGEFILEDVITYETGSTMAGTVFEGNTSGIQWEAVFGDTSLSVSFTVPEPAAVAAVLGAAALAFAAYRRRK